MKSAATVSLLALLAPATQAFAPAPFHGARCATFLNSDAAVAEPVVAEDAPVAEEGEPIAVEEAEEEVVPYRVWDHYVGGEDFRGAKFEFDPLRLAESYSPLVPFFREAELRHGRTAMLAIVGFFVVDNVGRIPGEQFSFAAVPHAIDAHDALLDTSMKQLLLWIALFDACITIPAVQATMRGERDAGDFGFPVPKKGRDDPDAMDKKRRSELLNGRLAMMAIGGIATQAVLTQGPFPYI